MPNTGRASESAATGILADEWAMAREMNETHPGPGEWVPVRAIVVRKDINPRIDARLNWDKVREYAQSFFDLPPVLVQKDTFVLINGNHRYNASIEKEVTSVAIRIEEVDVPDDELREAAFDANAKQFAEALNSKERSIHLEYLIKKHAADPEWTDARYAQKVGLSVWTVGETRRKKLGVRRYEPPSPREEADGEKGDTNRSRKLETQHSSPTNVTYPDSAVDPAPAAADSPGNVTGGKPAGYFAVGTAVADMQTGRVYRVVSKDSTGVVLESVGGGQRLTVGQAYPMRYRQSTVVVPDAQHFGNGEPGERPDDAEPGEAIGGFMEPQGDEVDLEPLAEADDGNSAWYIAQTSPFPISGGSDTTAPIAPIRDEPEDPWWTSPEGLQRIDGAIWTLCDAFQHAEIDSIVAAFGEQRMSYLGTGLSIACDGLAAMCDAVEAIG